MWDFKKIAKNITNIHFVGVKRRDFLVYFDCSVFSHVSRILYAQPIKHSGNQHWFPVLGGNCHWFHFNFLTFQAVKNTHSCPTHMIQPISALMSSFFFDILLYFCALHNAECFYVSLMHQFECTKFSIPIWEIGK